MISYKLATYGAVQGPRAGIVVGEEVFDLAGLTDKSSYATVLDVLKDWEAAQTVLDKAAEETGGGKIKGIPLEKVKLLVPVLYPSAIYCAGANYVDHVHEMATARNINPDPDPRSLGLKAWHFIKASRSVVGAESIVSLPAYSKMVDWEAELTAVIGRRAKDVPADKALEYIAGYTVGNDLSARDFTARSQVSDASPFKYDWVSHKTFDGSCPVGPWIVPARQIPDPQNLHIRLWVNDVLKQDSHTSKMIFSVAEQIAHLSARITLYPGDLILTGTPAGVGMARREFLKAGDVVRVWIEKIGTLTNTME
ncbi:MAG TPA: fumarylacetoacetate hydrolase family protein [Thermodesulfobacteriota bacterium]|nr:fumarylacetoacetate hydrolase family protein [Thermodesulfobacteriota bacterium]